MQPVVVLDGEEAVGHVDVGVALRVREKELPALGEAQEDVAGLDGGMGDGILETEGQPDRQTTANQ